jgi:hypothetical protein
MAAGAALITLEAAAVDEPIARPGWPLRSELGNQKKCYAMGSTESLAIASV